VIVLHFLLEPTGAGCEQIGFGRHGRIFGPQELKVVTLRDGGRRLDARLEVGGRLAGRHHAVAVGAGGRGAVAAVGVVLRGGAGGGVE